MDKLKSFCETVSPIKLSVTKDSVELDFKDQLFKSTEFLNEYPSVPIALRYYCIQNDITEIPLCVCGKNVTYRRDNPKEGFATFCGPKCSRENKNKGKEFNQYLNDKDWLYHQRITLQKSKEQIAQELNCSITPVNKWLKQHNIPDIKYNESNSIALTKLRDYDWLYNEHVVNKKTCENIGNELGVSKSTVSIALAKLNIIANEPNSYDRQIQPSKECLEIVDFIKTFYTGELFLDKRGIIGSLELDIYIPDKNLAIEYNGVFSHTYRPEKSSFSLQKGPKYHLTKTNECEKKDIQLLHIFSGSWKQNKEIWKSVIKNKLGYTENKIYARNCIIKHVSVHEKNKFLTENHIQGNSKSKIKLGLYHNHELVSLITFDSSRYNKNYDWELIRFCNKLNTNVVGAFSKLLSYFRKNYSGSIITYANRLYSNGNLYEKNGFDLLKINKPSYWYVKKNTELLLHKTNFKKQNLLKELYEPTWTESMLAKELDYNIIWDCGTKTYIMK